MKKILFMGAGILQSQAIERAKELGYYTIAIDQLSECPGKYTADEFYCISTTNTDEVYKLASSKDIDGILSYASDVSAYTAAVVCEKLGLPTNPSKSVDILTNKYLFRKFMKENDICNHDFCECDSIEDAYSYLSSAVFPLIVKPVDSSGSKGVTKINDISELPDAFSTAQKESRSRRVIIEKFINRKGYQIDGDGFVKDGIIHFFGVMDQHQNTGQSPYSPIGLSYPSVQGDELKDKARGFIQTIFDKLNMNFGAFNFEYIIDENDDIFVIEIGPRNGGNFIPNTVKYACGVDMMAASIKACVGDDYEDYLVPVMNRCATSYVVHSVKDGKFLNVTQDDSMQGKIQEFMCFVKEGDSVSRFRGGRDGLGLMVISYDDIDTMNSEINDMWNYVHVNVD